MEGRLQFSREQEAALAAIAEWRDGDRQVYYLAGYAGTGKTTLARHLGADYYAAYTGKAAYVMQEKGCAGATTIHKLIYVPREKSRQRLDELLRRADGDPNNLELVAEIAKERANLRKPAFTLNLDSPLRTARLLVVDECSMVDERIGHDLLSFGCKVLVLGDPFQLPPVYGGGFFTAREPNATLTEVHRQALDNPVLHLATEIRARGARPERHPLLVPKVTPELVLGVEQLIVGRNRTRSASNRRIRELLGRTSDLPETGDRVVCLRNNHELGLLNGATYKVTDVVVGRNGLELELDGALRVDAHREPFLGQEVEWWRERDAEKFDYGYALTCHKSQGSQWDSVGVIDESRAFNSSAARWLYTAVTRAAKELWVA